MKLKVRAGGIHTMENEKNNGQQIKGLPMRIHHLNCMTCCPLGGHFMDGITKGIGRSKIVCHTLLIESEEGLILIDTGIGMRDVSHPDERISPFFQKVLRPSLLEDETAHYQIRQLGFHPDDVRHIVLTHLDFDHAGGIDDFPRAKVHVMRAELDAATKHHNRSFIQKRRYSLAQLHHTENWNTYFPDGEKWYGFQAVKQLRGLPPEILMIPLVGHTEGHAGVAVETDRGWLLHAGDAYFFRGELEEDYYCTPGLRAYQKMMEVNRRMRQLNQQRLRSLSINYKHEVTIFSAHDAIEYLSLREGGDTYMLSHGAGPEVQAELGLS
jgi:glyoxylase-like metal-dependent hydrolase (beta-lactamase superfamily II)